MSSYLIKRKRDLQKAWGIVNEDRVTTPKGPVYLMDGPTPMEGDPECPEVATRCAWFIPVNDRGSERFVGRVVHFPVYRQTESGLSLIRNDSLDREHRKREAIKDAMKLLEAIDG